MKTIIIYSTKYGSVLKASQKLKKYLPNDVNIVNAKDKPDIKEYDTVILGGSIYASRIQKEMSAFVDKNLEELMTKRIGLFICAGTPKKSDSDLYLKKVFHKQLYDKAIVTGNFGYEYDLEKFSFIDRLIVRIVGVKKSDSLYYEESIEYFAEMINSE